jgi:hypothetical protein
VSRRAELTERLFPLAFNLELLSMKQGADKGKIPVLIPRLEPADELRAAETMALKSGNRNE